MKMREIAINNWQNLELHPLCSMFPEMNEKDFDSLLESMKSNGFLPSDPIVVWMDDDADEWVILDGQNRALAAEQAKVEPIFAQFKGDDLLGFVMARNMDRRHLNTGQKAAIAAKISDMSKDIKQADAAKQIGVGEASLRRFKFIQDRDPELADKVASGETRMEVARKAIMDGEKKMHEGTSDFGQRVEDVLNTQAGGDSCIESVDPKRKLGDKRRDRLAKLTKVEVTIHAKFLVMYDAEKQEYPDQLAKAISALEKGGLAEVEVINEGDE